MNKENNYNPECPYSKKDCIQNQDSDIECSSCKEYGNGVRATGGIRKFTIGRFFISLIMIQLLFIVIRVFYDLNIYILFLPVGVIIFTLIILFLYANVKYNSAKNDNYKDYKDRFN